ncbi:MAG: hypothetical protein J3K34DRAFT_54446 [Monoraphidium minutum]|nr:MAG: hypothetical protein J3K34DRAFT_54446 [Monoraphidium minutum]
MQPHPTARAPRSHMKVCAPARLEIRPARGTPLLAPAPFAFHSCKGASLQPSPPHPHPHPPCPPLAPSTVCKTTAEVPPVVRARANAPTLRPRSPTSPSPSPPKPAAAAAPPAPSSALGALAAMAPPRPAAAAWRPHRPALPPPPPDAAPLACRPPQVSAAPGARAQPRPPARRQACPRTSHPPPPRCFSCASRVAPAPLVALVAPAPHGAQMGRPRAALPRGRAGPQSEPQRARLALRWGGESFTPPQGPT